MSFIMAMPRIILCILHFLGLTLVSFGLEELDKSCVIIEKVAEPVELGEGPHWDVKSQKLYYVDLLSARIFRYDPVTGSRKYASLNESRTYVGVVIPVEGMTDKFIVGVDRDVVIMTWNSDHNMNNPPIKKLACLDTDRNDTRINDGKCDAAGRLWIGTMAVKAHGYVTPNRATLYRISEDGKVAKVLSPVSISNGLTWGLQNDVMYYIDSPTRQILSFDYNNVDGSLSNKKIVFDLNNYNELKEGVPDGMTIDAEGNLWLAVFGGQAVIQVDPKKRKLLRRIELPAKKVSSVAFGGPDLEDLYVTTARIDSKTGGVREQLPDSGALFRITGLGVKGVAAYNCKYDL